MVREDAHVIVVGAGITGLLLCQGLKKLGIKYTLIEKDTALNSRSNEWTMAIHWALPKLKEILPAELFAKIPQIACNPEEGVHSGLYPIIHGETGDQIIGVPYENGLRVPRSRMRSLCAEGLDVNYGRQLVHVICREGEKEVTAVLDDETTITGTLLVGAEGGRSRVREILMGSAQAAETTKFPIFHTNMTVCYGDAEKALAVRERYPTSFLALSERSFHAFQSISGMPDGPDHPESWTFHMAMAWMGQNDNTMSHGERLALVKSKAAGMAEPARSAFLWMPNDTLVHRADISYWVSQPWDNKQGRMTLAGDAAHPMPPYRGQGLNHCICDISNLVNGLKGVVSGHTAQEAAVSAYESEMVPRGAEEVKCSVENGMMLHDWNKIRESPVFNKGFKPMDGHGVDKAAVAAQA